MQKSISHLQRTLNIWAIILIIWSIYRAKLNMPEWFDEFLAKPIIFILPVFLFIKRIEKKDFISSICLSPKRWRTDILLGFVIGFFFMGSALLANYIKYGHFFGEISNSTVKTLVYFGLIAAATAISEEILSRGFILNKLYQDSGNPYKASFLATALFITIHIPILFTTLKLSGLSLLFFILTLIALSLANSFIFIQRKSLVLPIFIHGFYNLAISLFI